MAKPRMKTTEQTEVSEAQIAVHWKEEAYYQPSEKFKAQANMRDPHVFDRFGLDKFPDCFREYADMLTWFEPYHTVLDTSDAPFWKWFAGGKINASYNCVDRQLATYANKAAFIFVPEPEAERDVVMTYQELYDRVNEVAAMLRDTSMTASMRWPPCFGTWESKLVTASPFTCRWSRSCRSQCWRVRGWESSTLKSSAGSAVRRAAPAFTIRAAASWLRWTATGAMAPSLITRRTPTSRSGRRKSWGRT